MRLYVLPIHDRIPSYRGRGIRRILHSRRYSFCGSTQRAYIYPIQSIRSACIRDIYLFQGQGKRSNRPRSTQLDHFSWRSSKQVYRILFTYIREGSSSISFIIVMYSKPYFSYRPIWLVERYTSRTPSSTARLSTLSNRSPA